MTVDKLSKMKLTWEQEKRIEKKMKTDIKSENNIVSDSERWEEDEDVEDNGHVIVK